MKVAVITGAASGIGLALTQVILNQGHTVIMIDNNEVKLQKEVEKLRSIFNSTILPFCCDITQLNELTHLAQEIEKNVVRIDWIYNNAGIIGELGPIWDLSPEKIHEVIQVNLFGMIHTIKAFSPFLFKQAFRSHIINMASLYALCSGSQTASYSMSKHAVLALSESLHFDLIRMQKPVDVSVVLPSFTDTALLSQDRNNPSPLKSALKNLLAHSRPAIDTAKHIVNEVEQKKFYILPDREVKGYCEERTKAIILQESPHVNNIEKLMNSLIKRQESEKAI